MKWKQASAKYRKDIARALTAATPAMLAAPAAGPMMRHSPGTVRWGFNTKQRPDPPAEVAEILLGCRNSAPLSALAELPPPARCSTRPPAGWTGRTRPRAPPGGTARFWPTPWTTRVELGPLETNPIRVLKWTAPKVSSQVDRRSVVNPRQARTLLEAVRARPPSGPRLVTFFAVMYYAGLRPEEAINLSRDNVILPPHGQDDDWGELHIRSATPDAGGEWTDDGESPGATAA